MTILSIELPMPPSINRTYRGAYGGGRLLLTDAAKAWQTEAGYILNGWDVQPIKGKCAVFMSVYMPYKEKGDMHNFNPKLVLDALQGHAYSNDRFVTMLHVDRRFSKANPHIKLEIVSLDSELLLSIVMLHVKGADTGDPVNPRLRLLLNGEEI